VQNERDDGRLLPIHEECFAQFRDEGYIHPAQLYREKLATYISCIAKENSNRELHPRDGRAGAESWNEFMMRYLPDLNDSETIVSIDPFVPFTVPDYVDWINRLPPCVYTESGVEEYPCREEILSQLRLLWNATHDLPFLPSSQLTITSYGRLALAESTRTLWETLGIDTSPAWINPILKSFPLSFNPSQNVK
jgi:hypothetical protein